MGPQPTFPQKKNLAPTKHCFSCSEKLAQERDAKRENGLAPPPTEKKRRGPKAQPLEGYATLE
jgi:hypothetical protein